MIRYYSFPAPLVLKVSGKDTTRYLNARLTNDAKKLGSGDTMRAAQLSAQGRTEGFFSVLCLDPGDSRRGSTNFLVGEARDIAEVITAFKRFIVADRVDVLDLSPQAALTLVLLANDEDNRSVAKLFGAEQPVPPRKVIALDEETLLFSSLRPGFHALEILSLSESATARVQELLSSVAAVAMTQPEFLLERLRRSNLSFPEEIAPERAFLEAEQRNAISFQKGCYVGQEVMEKIDAYGTTPRVVMKLIGEGEPQVGDEITNQLQGGESIGKVITAAFDSEIQKWLAFVTIKRSMSTNDSTVYYKQGSGRLSPVAGGQ